VTALPSFGYVQARAQARLAGLPCENDWQRLEATRSLSAFLEEARSTALRPWVAGLSGESAAHDIERGIRAIYRSEVEAVARWVPERWRAAVRWVQWVPQLLILRQVLAGGRAPQWMARDPFLASLLGSQGDPDPAQLRAAGLGPLATAIATGGDVGDAWLEAWRARCPCSRGAIRENLDRLVTTLLGHQRQFLATPPDRAWALRRELDQRLRHLFHACLLQPLVVFVYLALVALGLERLRAELVGRALFAAEVP
jgi:hypothetical protein